MKEIAIVFQQEEHRGGASRRGFLKMTASAAAVCPARPADTVGLGFIGMGGRGMALLRSTEGLPVRVAHVCDVDSTRLTAARKRAAELGHAGVRASMDLRRVLEDREVEAVVIATPDHWHAPATLLACEAGKDVYVEKPVSHNYREGRWMVEAARRYARVIQAGLQARSRPVVRRAIEVAQSGRLGRLLAAKAWNSQLRRNIGRSPDASPPPGVDYETWVGPAEMLPFRPNRFHYNWHWHWNFGTGDLGNDGAHQIDICRWVLGLTLPARVSGMGETYFFDDDQETPDTMFLAFDFGRSVIFWEMRIWTPYPLEEIENGVAVYGTDAMMRIGQWGREWGYQILDRQGKRAEWIKEASPDEHLKNFLHCVRSRARPNCDIEEGHLSSAVCHLGNICARTGRNFRFDAKREAIPEDPEAHALLGRRYRNHWATPKAALVSGD